MKVEFLGSRSIVKELTATLTREIADTAKVTQQAAQDSTPRRSGRARAAWTSQADSSGFSVKNQVPYIERLEAGSSRQAPSGIIGPTITKVKGRR